jgi:hypothetical protein
VASSVLQSIPHLEIFAEVWKDRQRWEFLLGDIGGWVQDVIGYWGAFGLVFLLFLENLFPPIPSELILPLAGFLVGRGELGWVQALVGSTTGSLLGAYVLYGLGRWGGRPLVLRFGRVLRVTERELDRAERWFDSFWERGGFVRPHVAGGSQRGLDPRRDAADAAR